MSESKTLIIEISEGKPDLTVPSFRSLKIATMAMETARDISEFAGYCDETDRENAAIVVTAILSAVTTVIRRGTLS